MNILSYRKARNNLFPNTSKFNVPEISAFNFLRLFFSLLVKRGVISIKNDFAHYLYEFRHGEYSSEINRRVLSDIGFKSNGISWYSSGISNALYMLRTVGFLPNTVSGVEVDLITIRNKADYTISQFSDEHVSALNSIIDCIEQKYPECLRKDGNDG